MTSGGARSRSGPAPDPNALRRDRADDAGWTVLPVEGFAGEVPKFPLSRISVYYTEYENNKPKRVFDEEGTLQRREDELELWATLWAKQQAFMWAKLHLEYEVAAYVRAYIESTGADSNSGLKTAALRMAAEIGLSLPGMHSLRWKFAEDELAEKRDEVIENAGPSARDRWAARTGA